MKEYLEDLVNRMSAHEPNVKSSDKSPSAKAHSEAAAIDDPAYLPLLREMIETHTAKKYNDYRDSVYYIMGKLLQKHLYSEYLAYYIERIAKEENKYVISSMLDRIWEMTFRGLNIPDEISIRPILDCALSDKWQIRHSALSALGAADRDESREILKYYISQTDEKKYKYEITYANKSLGNIGKIEDIPVLQQHIKSRSPDIKGSAATAIKKIEEREKQ